MKQIYETRKTDFPFTALGATGDIRSDNMDFSAIHLESLNRWTIRLRGPALTLEVISNVTGASASWQNPSVADVAGYDAALLPELALLMQQVEEGILITAEETLNLSDVFQKRSDFCWSAVHDRKVILLMLTTLRSVVQDEAAEEAASAITRRQRVTLAGQKIGLDEKVIELVLDAVKPAVEPKEDALCWEIMYFDDQRHARDWNQTPFKALTDLKELGDRRFDESTNAFIQAAKADVLPCWDSLVIRLLSQHINLGLLRKEVGCKLQACT